MLATPERLAKTPDPSLITTTHIIYGLHALSILIGLTSAITVVGAFVFGIPSIIAVVVNYVNQPNARGTFLESHFRWQIRTFWYALMWILIGIVLFLTIIGIPHRLDRHRRRGNLGDLPRLREAG